MTACPSRAQLAIRQSLALLVCTAISAFASTASAQSTTLADRIQQLKGKQVATTPATATPAAAINPTYQRMLASTVLIQCESDEGLIAGTGWIVDADHRLIVTNQHVVEGFLDCWVYFPEFENGRLITDPVHSIVPSRANLARVVDSDVSYDLALIQLNDPLPSGAIALEIASEPASPGSAIHSLAGSTVGAQSLWVYSTGHVRQTVRGLMANEYQATLLESDMATNSGNSGGPVCNDAGEVVAVVEGARTDATLVSIYVERDSLLEYLADSLRCVDPSTPDDRIFAAERHLAECRASYGLELVNAVIAESPESAELLSLRGWCWFDLDDLDNAKADFKDAVAVRRTHSDAHSGLGHVALVRGEIDQAIEHFTDAIRNDSKNIHAFVQRARCRGTLGEYAAALPDIESALRLDESCMDAIRLRAFARIELGDTDAGLADLEEVVEFFSDDPQIFCYYGQACLANDDYENAGMFFKHANELSPEDPVAIIGLGINQFYQDEFDSAEQLLRTALELDPNRAIAVHYLGLIKLIDRDTEALAYLRRAAELDPENEEFSVAITEAKKLLDQAVSAQRLVSTQAIPPKFIGTWGTVVNHEGVRLEMLFTLQSDRRYQFRSTVRKPNGEIQKTTESGQFGIDGDHFTTLTDGEAEKVSVPFKWEGDKLLMFVEEINAWMQFYRQ